MAIDIRQTMPVKAPSELVWTWLLAAENTIGALPGATLGQVVDDRHFTAKMKVKVGTVSVVYNGAIELVNVDPQARSVQIAGKWKEDGGSGSATMELTGRVIPKDDGTTEVEFVGTADPVGRVVQFGKGMLQGIGEQLFEKFAKKAGAQMEKAALEAHFAGPPSNPAGAEQALVAANVADEAAAVAAAVPVDDKAAAALARADAAAARADAAAARAEEAMRRADAAYELAQKAGAKVTELATAGADEKEEEVNAIAAFFQWIASLFGRKKRR